MVMDRLHIGMKTFMQFLEDKQQENQVAGELAKLLQQYSWGKTPTGTQRGIFNSMIPEMIQNLLRRLSPDVAAAIWKQYAPAHVPFNWGQRLSSEQPNNNWTGD